MSDDNRLPALEIDCEVCNGEGEVCPGPPFSPDYRCRCHACGGLGTLLTPAGEQVVTCVLRRLRITARTD